MKSTIRELMSADPNVTSTDEQRLVDQILESVNSLKPTPEDNAKIASIKSDLLSLKSKVGESDFAVRYLKGREKALQQFIDQFPSMLGYWNKDLINVHSNKAYADYFGKVPEEIRGNSIRDLLGDKIFKLNQPYIIEVLKGVTQTFEREIPTPRGVVSTLANYIPHQVGDQVVGFFVIVTDISDRKKLEERTKTLENSLYERSRLSSLGQMASGIAHEINNPVTIIYSNACLLLRELKKPDFNKEYLVDRLAEIERTAERIEKIVDGLRSVARGSGENQFESLDLSEIVDQVISICQGRFRKSGLKVSWSAPAEKVFALCNQVQVSEILLNILNNSFDAIKDIPDGTVTIWVGKSDQTCQIRIANNGPAISADDRGKLFMPFFTTKGKEGTGLGLKISQDLAAANNGSLVLSDSQETEFILSLRTPDSRI